MRFVRLVFNWITFASAFFWGGLFIIGIGLKELYAEIKHKCPAQTYSALIRGDKWLFGEDK